MPSKSEESAVTEERIAHILHEASAALRAQQVSNDDSASEDSKSPSQAQVTNTHFFIFLVIKEIKIWKPLHWLTRNVSHSQNSSSLLLLLLVFKKKKKKKKLLHSNVGNKRKKTNRVSSVI